MGLLFFFVLTDPVVRLQVVEGDVHLVAVLVDEHGVAVREGGAAHVLTAEADVEALHEGKERGSRTRGGGARLRARRWTISPQLVGVCLMSF